MLTTSRPLTREKMPRGDARGRSGWATVPGLLVSVLPFGGCPACWPLYAGALSALGLGALLSESYLLPLTSVLLTFSVGALAWQAKRRRGYQPFVLGLLATTGILLGKFVVHSGLLAGSGVAVLVRGLALECLAATRGILLPAVRPCRQTASGRLVPI